MIQPPQGTVTFMFTDIQGSTKLWETYPDGMKAALARHDALMAEIMEAHNGYLVKTTGDGLLAAFASASDCVAASVAIHQGLLTDNWDGVGSLLVRIGMHSGEAQFRDGDYYGPTVNRAARIMGIGHGGQTLISVATHELLADTLPNNLTLQDLGEHRLKDLTRPEYVYQLNHSEMDNSFAPLKSLSSLPNNLPRQLTSFVGRTEEVHAIADLLGHAPMVTLTGIGGTGKTRLSLQVAAELIDQHADGVWFVELASLFDPSLVAKNIADVLQVAEVPGESNLDTLVRSLGAKHMVLVLDNCEHLLESCADIATALLKGCPGVRILASSREVLNVTGETSYAVPPLPLPENNADLTELFSIPSVQLFVDRTQQVKPQFQLTEENSEAVGTICRHLDGIPLALELAAARVKIMPPQKLVERLEDRFRILTGGKREALPHQQTLRATIDWSYDLLEETEQLLLNRLAVFQGGFAMEAAEGICSDAVLNELDVMDYLGQLVQKSLVEADEYDGEARYSLLETVRQYAQEKLDATGELSKIHKAHLAYFLNLAETGEHEFSGADQAHWLQRLHQEHDNFRGALRWAIQAHQWGAAQRMCGALGNFWSGRGHLREGRAWLEQALSVREGVELEVQAKALRFAGSLAWMQQGEMDDAQRYTEESLDLYRESGDFDGIGRTLNTLGNVSNHQENHEKAKDCYAKSLEAFRQHGESGSMVTTLNNLASFAIHHEKDYGQARLLLEEALSLSRKSNHLRNISFALANLGEVDLLEDRLQSARRQLCECIELFKQLDDPLLQIMMSSVMAAVIYKEGFAELAARIQGACLRWMKESDSRLQGGEQKIFDRTQEALKVEMGEDAYAKAFEAGQQLSFEDMVALAVRKPST